MAQKPSSEASPFSFDFTKHFADMKWPVAPDASAISTLFQRNMEALTAANQIALEGAQEVARRNMEIFQQAMVDMNATMQFMASGGTPEARAAKHAETVKKTYEHALKNLQELGKLIQKSNSEAIKVLTDRFNEVTKEITSLAKQSK